MKRILLTIAVGISMFMVSCSGNQSKTDETQVLEKVKVVSTSLIAKETVSKKLDYTANLAAFEENYLAPASPGRIAKIYVEAGDHVKKGQLLVSMDKTQLKQTEIQINNLKIDLNRIKTLYESGSASKQSYDQLKTQVDVAQTNLDFLKENTTLIAPFSGIITDRYFEELELYSSAPNTQAGKAAIVTLMQINPVKAIINISEKYFTEMKEGREVTVRLDIFPAEEFKGKVYRIYPTIDASTRTFKVEVSIPNSKERLRPGMYAKVSIDMGIMESLFVPGSSVLQQTGTSQRYIFFYKDGEAIYREVKIGKRYDDKIEITGEGVVEGSEIIIAGHANLVNGSKVKKAE